MQGQLVTVPHHTYIMRQVPKLGGWCGKVYFLSEAHVATMAHFARELMEVTLPPDQYGTVLDVLVQKQNAMPHQSADPLAHRFCMMLEVAVDAVERQRAAEILRLLGSSVVLFENPLLLEQVEIHLARPLAHSKAVMQRIEALITTCNQAVAPSDRVRVAMQLEQKLRELQQAVVRGRETANIA